MAAYVSDEGAVEKYVPFDSYKRAKTGVFHVRVDETTNTRDPQGKKVTLNHEQMALVLINERPERYEEFFQLYVAHYTNAFAGWNTSDDDNEMQYWEGDEGANTESYGRDIPITRVVRMAHKSAVEAVRQYEKTWLSQQYLEW